MKSKPRRSERPGTTHHHKPPRRVGRRWPHAQQHEKPYHERPVCAAQRHETHQPQREKLRRGVTNGAATRPKSPSPPRNQRPRRGPRRQQGGDRRQAERGKGGRDHRPAGNLQGRAASAGGENQVSRPLGKPTCVPQRPSRQRP